MIVFNRPSITSIEREYMEEALSTLKLCGDGKFTKKVYELFEKKLNVNQMLLTTSGTSALEMASILADLNEGDEVIVPSYTFVSTVNAFVLHGVKPIFAEIEKETLNIDPSKIEELITSKTKAIFSVHYAGVICDMDKINEIAKKYNLYVIEDAAQAVGSVYKGKYAAGTIGDMGCYSFHETKNYVMGEGGAIVIKDNNMFRRGEIVREKGTDRSQFIRGEIDKYTWKDYGSSFLPSDILAAILCGQIERFDEIMNKRIYAWNTYHEGLKNLEEQGKLRRPIIPEYSTHNAHMYYILLEDEEKRNNMIKKLKEKGVHSVFHYIPLHTTSMGRKFGYKEGMLPITEECARRILRLPMFADIKDEELRYIIDTIYKVI